MRTYSGKGVKCTTCQRPFVTGETIQAVETNGQILPFCLKTREDARQTGNCLDPWLLKQEGGFEAEPAELTYEEL